MTARMEEATESIMTWIRGFIYGNNNNMSYGLCGVIYLGVPSVRWGPE